MKNFFGYMTLPLGLLVLGLLAQSLISHRTGHAQDSDNRTFDTPEQIRQSQAKAWLQLAELQLEARLAANKKIPNLYTEKELRRYRTNVNVAKSRLALVQKNGDVVELYRQLAREQAKVARTDYEESIKANTLKAGTYARYETEIEELRLKAEIAELRLAMWEQPEANLLSIMDHVHWQLEQLSEEVLELQKRFEQLELRGAAKN